MALDDHYVTDFTLDAPILDKITGLPLAGGKAYFFEDNARTIPKSVYQLSGSPPNYTYTPLPNPITLNAKGCFQDAGGNDVAVYAYPYDNSTNPPTLSLYYVAVYDSNNSPPLGTPQFTREAWPNITAGTNPASQNSGSIANAITNGSFGEVLFSSEVEPYVITVGVGTTEIEIAPNWTLLVNASGSSTITVTQEAIQGATLRPTDPPYDLKFVTAGSITSAYLRQRFYGNPAIFSPDVNNVGGYLSTSILLGPSSQTTIYYAPQGIALQTLLTASNGAAGFAEFNNTVLLTAVANNNSPPDGYVDILISLKILGTTQIGSVQITPVADLTTIPTYQQTTLNQQASDLFYYHQPKLNYKPINSYLVGWDFPKNPAQFLGDSVGIFAGANSAQYCWDQTITYQSATNSLSVSRGTAGELVLTSVQPGQYALIQYLEVDDVREILSGNVSVNIAGYTSRANGIIGTVSLYVAAGTAVPVLPLSVVLTLDTNGKPATQTQPTGGTWTEITRHNLGDARFVLDIAQTSGPTKYNDIALSGFGLDNAGAVTSATGKFFAIVVGFESMAIADTVTIESISLCPGDIPTRPAPKTRSQEVLDCQQYYWKTFLQGTKPIQNAGVGTGEYTWGNYSTLAGTKYGPNVVFPTPMRAIPTLTFYNPAAANANIRDESAPADLSAAATTNISKNCFALAAGAGAATVGSLLGVHITADARLGIV